MYGACLCAAGVCKIQQLNTHVSTYEQMGVSPPPPPPPPRSGTYAAILSFYWMSNLSILIPALFSARLTVVRRHNVNDWLYYFFFIFPVIFYSTHSLDKSVLIIREKISHRYLLVVLFFTLSSCCSIEPPLICLRFVVLSGDHLCCDAAIGIWSL